MPVARLLPVAALGLVLALAGCTDGPPVWGHLVPDDAPAEGGLGPRRVAVRLHDGARPLEGAVILFWTDPSPPERDGPVHVQRLGLRTQGGQAVGWVPDDRVVHAIGASRDHTEEWVVDAFAGGDELSIRLYPRTLQWQASDAWAGAEVAVPYANAYIWHPTELRLDADDAANLAMQSRVASLDGVLRWENTPTRFADLGVIAATRGAPSGCDYFDSEDDYLPGSYEQAFGMPYFGCGFIIPDAIDRIEPPIDIGPATDSHVVAPLEGVPYTLDVTVGLVASYGWQPFEEEYADREVEATWVPTQADDAGGPGQTAPGAWLGAALALLGSAWLRRRR